MRVAIACALALLVVAVAGAAATTRRPGLDRSYGEDGVVEVTAPFATAKDKFSAIKGFAATATGAAYAVGDVYPCLPAKCREGTFLLRYRADGSADRSFGDKGTVFLNGDDEDPALIADGAGRAVVVERHKEVTDIRRFLPSGEPDESFGADGTVELTGSEAQGEVIGLPGGRLMTVASQGVPGTKEKYETIASKVRLTELLSDGREDKRFGRSGVLAFTIPRKGPLGAVVRTSNGAMTFGSVGFFGQTHRRPWMWRITASGHADRRFNRNAQRSLHRLGTLGEFPELASILPRSDGTVAMVGTLHEHFGFVLRLRADGRLDAGFGDRGLTILQATVEGAVGGTGGAIFIVGQGKRHYYYSAYRVLGDGRLDPGYHGDHGVKVPLPGEGVWVEALAGGRALVAGAGSFECREACPPEPGIARFIE